MIEIKEIKLKNLNKNLFFNLFVLILGILFMIYIGEFILVC